LAACRSMPMQVAMVAMMQSRQVRDTYSLYQ